MRLINILGYRWPLVTSLLGAATVLSLWIVFIVPGSDESAIRWTLSALAQSLAGILAVVVLLFTVLWVRADRASDALIRAQDDIYQVLRSGLVSPRPPLQARSTYTIVEESRREFCRALKEESPSLVSQMAAWCDRHRLTPEIYYVNLCAIVQAIHNRFQELGTCDLEKLRQEGLQAGLKLEATRKVRFPGGRTAMLTTDFSESVRLRSWDLLEPEALASETSRSIILGPITSLPSGRPLQERLFTIFEKHRAFHHLGSTTQFRQFLRVDFAAIIGTLVGAIAIALLLLPAAGRISPYLIVIPMALALFGGTFLIVRWYQLVVSPTARETKRLSQKM